MSWAIIAMNTGLPPEVLVTKDDLLRRALEVGFEYHDGRHADRCEACKVYLEIESALATPDEPRGDAAKLEEIAKWHEEIGANHHAELEATRDRIDWSSQGMLRDRGDFHKAAAVTIRNALNR